MPAGFGYAEMNVSHFGNTTDFTVNCCQLPLRLTSFLFEKRLH